MPFRVLRLASSEAADRRQAVQIRQAQLFNAGVVEEQEVAAWARLVEQLSFVRTGTVPVPRTDFVQI